MQATVRPGRADDRAAPRLLYVSAQPYYDAFTGSPRRALRVLEAIWPKPAHTASFAVTRVAESGGGAAGVMAVFPADEGDALARRFLSLALVRLPPWHWPTVLRHLRASAEVMPVPRPHSLYVDALATEADRRRQGVASSLLEEAERVARMAGLRGVSLDTGLENQAARALYEARGFEATGEKRAPNERVERAVGGPGFVSYFKPV